MPCLLGIAASIAHAAHTTHGEHVSELSRILRIAELVQHTILANLIGSESDPTNETALSLWEIHLLAEVLHVLAKNVWFHLPDDCCTRSSAGMIGLWLVDQDHGPAALNLVGVHERALIAKLAHDPVL